MKTLLTCLGVLLSALQVHALLLGGVEVPKDKVIVYLLIGHSNMSGFNTDSDDQTAPRIWKYNWFQTRKWEAAREQRGNDIYGLSGRGSGGPGMPFLKGMATAFPNYHFGVISNASISCTLRGINRGINSSGMPADSNRYWKGARLYNELPMIVSQVAKDVTLGGVICMLGSVEATRTSEAICRAFSDDVALMMKDLRADLNSPNLPYIMGDYEAGATGNFAVTLPWPKIIDEQIKMVPSKLTNSATVNTVGIQMLDDHHYNMAGQQEFSKRIINVIKAKGWVPPPSPSGTLSWPMAREVTRAWTPVFRSESGTMAFARGNRRNVFTTDGKRLIAAGP